MTFKTSNRTQRSREKKDYQPNETRVCPGAVDRYELMSLPSHRQCTLQMNGPYSI